MGGMSETLSNGIELSEPWPAKGMDFASWQPMRVPYLEKAVSGPIPIDVGRQLFVDDFLTDRCTMSRVHFGSGREGQRQQEERRTHGTAKASQNALSRDPYSGMEC